MADLFMLLICNQVVPAWGLTGDLEFANALSLYGVKCDLFIFKVLQI